MEEQGVSKTMMGLSLTFATISELPVLFYSDRLLERWDARGLILVSLAAYVVRALAYTIITAPWMFLTGAAPAWADIFRYVGSRCRLRGQAWLPRD